MPGSFPEAALVPTLSHEEAPVSALYQEKYLGPPHPLRWQIGPCRKHTVPARHKLRGQLKVPENMRLYLTRDVILTPLALRPPKGPPKFATTAKRAPVPVSSSEKLRKEHQCLPASPGKAPVPTSSPERAPVHTMSSMEAPVPASSQAARMKCQPYPKRKHQCPLQPLRKYLSLPCPRESTSACLGWGY